MPKNRWLEEMPEDIWRMIMANMENPPTPGGQVGGMGVPEPGAYSEAGFARAPAETLTNSLNNEAMNLLLQNIINAQSPRPGYQVYGLPNPNDPSGRIPSYYESPRPAAPNPALAEMMLNLGKAAGQMGPEQREAQQWRDTYDPEAARRMAEMKVNRAQYENQGVQSRTNAMSALMSGQAGRTPEEQMAAYSLMMGQPGQGYVDTGKEAQAAAAMFDADVKPENDALTALYTQMNRLDPDKEKDKAQIELLKKRMMEIYRIREEKKKSYMSIFERRGGTGRQRALGIE